MVCVRNVPPLLSSPHVPVNMQQHSKAISNTSESELQKYVTVNVSLRQSN